MPKITQETQALMNILAARTTLRVGPLLKELGEAIAAVDTLVAEATAIENAVRAIRYSGENEDLKAEMMSWENLGGSLMSSSRDLRRLTDAIVDKVANMDRIEALHEKLVEAYESAPDGVDMRSVLLEARQRFF